VLLPPLHVALNSGHRITFVEFENFLQNPGLTRRADRVDPGSVQSTPAGQGCWHLPLALRYELDAQMHLLRNLLGISGKKHILQSFEPCRSLIWPDGQSRHSACP